MHRKRGLQMRPARWWVPLVLLLAFGCASFAPPTPSPPASPQSDAQAKLFQPAAGKANVYIARAHENMLMGSAAAFTVTVDGTAVGALAPDFFFLFTLPPGLHRLSASSSVSTDQVQVTVEAGKNYYYELTGSSTDTTAKVSLSLVILEPMARIMVGQYKRAQGAIE